MKYSENHLQTINDGRYFHILRKNVRPSITIAYTVHSFGKILGACKTNKYYKSLQFSLEHWTEISAVCGDLLNQ